MVYWLRECSCRSYEPAGHSPKPPTLQTQSWQSSPPTQRCASTTGVEYRQGHRYEERCRSCVGPRMTGVVALFFLVLCQFLLRLSDVRIVDMIISDWY